MGKDIENDLSYASVGLNEKPISKSCLTRKKLKDKGDLIL